LVRGREMPPAILCRKSTLARHSAHWRTDNGLPAISRSRAERRKSAENRW
jgi:hypothetical protein